MKLPRWFALGLFALTPVRLVSAEPQPATPLGNPSDWITASDYPKMALRDQVEGVVRFKLEVDKFGEPTSCIVTTSSGSAHLDATACNLIMVRARFEPARDQRGNPTGGTYSNSVRFNVPKFVDQVEPGILIRSYLVNRKGDLSDCRIERVEGSAAKKKKAGPISCGPLVFREGYRDQAGNLIEKKIRVTEIIELVDP